MSRPTFTPLCVLLASAMFLAPARLLSAQIAGAVCWGGGGGGFSTRRAEVAYAVAADSAGARLEAAVLVRAPRAWLRLPPPDSQPAARRPDGTPRSLSGATVGPLWVQYERATGTLWLGGDSVALGTANVALVEVDPAGRPRVVGTARVEPRLPAGHSGCRPPANREEAVTFESALLSAVRRDASVREFLDR